METTSIKQLKTIKDQLRVSLKNISPSTYGSQTFGGESEYTARGVVAGIDALTTDLGGLIRAPKRFIQLSSHAERVSLAQQFTNLKKHVDAKQISQVVTTLEQIKPVLRAYGVRTSKGRQEEFVTHIDDMQRKCESLREFIDTLGAKKTEAESLNVDISSVYEDLSTKLDELENRNKQISNIFDESQSNSEIISEKRTKSDEELEEIRSLLIEAKSAKETIEQFSKRVDKRESQLDKQENTTVAYEETLKNYGIAQKKILNEAGRLIESAKTALEYKTAEGISAAFSEKYRESKEDKSTLAWVGSAGVFLVIAVAIGIWIVWEKDLQLDTIVGRLSLIPVLIGASWFCASQYIKQRNIAEDYAYKSVLAKSIVGFSEQLSNENNKGEEYSHYIKSVLSEIHHDPLRKHGTKEKGVDKKPRDIESIVKDIELIKSVSEKFSKNQTKSN